MTDKPFDSYLETNSFIWWKSRTVVPHKLAVLTASTTRPLYFSRPKSAPSIVCAEKSYIVVDAILEMRFPNGAAVLLDLVKERPNAFLATPHIFAYYISFLFY